MRSSHKNRSRNRHRSGGGGGNSGGGGNPLSRVYESNGPDVKVRGTAQTIADKYLQLGRDAQSSGDIVMAESYFQHAEHYLRIVFAAQAYNQQSQQQYRRPDEDDDEDDGDDMSEASVEQRGAPVSAEPDGTGEQPVLEGGPNRSRSPSASSATIVTATSANTGNRASSANRGIRAIAISSATRAATSSRSVPSGRERFKPRWQDRRDQNQQGGEQRPAPQPRNNEEQPRATEAPAQPAAPATASDTAWEAPSFLRRPAPAPAPERTAEPKPAPAPAVSEDAPAAPAPAPKRRYERKPRKDAAAETAPAAEPNVAEPAAD